MDLSITLSSYLKAPVAKLGERNAKSFQKNIYLLVVQEAEADHIDDEKRDKDGWDSVCGYCFVIRVFFALCV